MAADALSQVVKFDPEQTIVFTPPFDGKEPKTYLTLTNTAPESNLAYKVKTTAPRNYQVKPFQGIIPAGKSQKVEITIVPEAPVSAVLF